jgi:hypothetical protein
MGGRSPAVTQEIKGDQELSCRMQKPSTLARISIGYSILVWLYFTVYTLSPMPTAGLRAYTSLANAAVFTVVLLVDIFATLGFSKGQPGCLCIPYILGWGVLALIGAPSIVCLAVDWVRMDPDEIQRDYVLEFLFLTILSVLPIFKTIVAIVLVKRHQEEEPVPPEPTEDPPSEER